MGCLSRRRIKDKQKGKNKEAVNEKEEVVIEQPGFHNKPVKNKITKKVIKKRGK